MKMKMRKNPFCVISKGANENGWHDLQANSAWNTNPYDDNFALVPDDMVLEILETFGYCDIELNEDGTEVVSFTARKIPLVEVPEEEVQTPEERIRILEETVAEQGTQLSEMTEYQAEMLYELSLMQLGVTE